MPTQLGDSDDSASTTLLEDDHELVQWIYAALINPGYLFFLYRISIWCAMLYVVTVNMDGCGDLKGAKASDFVGVTLRDAVCRDLMRLRAEHGMVLDNSAIIALSSIATVSFTTVPLPRRHVLQICVTGLVLVVIQSMTSNVSALFGSSHGDDVDSDIQYPYALRWAQTGISIFILGMPIGTSAVATMAHEHYQLEAMLRLRHVHRLLWYTESYSVAVLARKQEEAARRTIEATLGYAAHELRNPLFVIANVTDGLVERMEAVRGAAKRIGQPAPGAGCEPADRPLQLVAVEDSPAAGSKLMLCHKRHAKLLASLEFMTSDMAIVTEAVANMKRVTDDVLDHQKLHTAKLQLKPTTVRARRVVQHTVRRFAARSRAQAARHAATRSPFDLRGLVQPDEPIPKVPLVDGIPVFVAPDVPERLVVDGYRLEQLLSNGLSNADKHTEGLSSWQATDRDQSLDIEAPMVSHSTSGVEDDDETVASQTSHSGSSLPPRSVGMAAAVRRRRSVPGLMGLLCRLPRAGQEGKPLAWVLDPEVGGIWVEMRILSRPGRDRPSNTPAAAAPASGKQVPSLDPREGAPVHRQESRPQEVTAHAEFASVLRSGSTSASAGAADGILPHWTAIQPYHAKAVQRSPDEVELGMECPAASGRSKGEGAGVAAGGAGAADGPLVLSISVYNTSVKGLDNVDVAKLFKPFEQGAGPGRTLTKGTGLGLPICRLLARLMGGGVGLTDVFSPKLDSSSTPSADVSLGLTHSHMHDSTPSRGASVDAAPMRRTVTPTAAADHGRVSAASGASEPVAKTREVARGVYTGSYAVTARTSLSFNSLRPRGGGGLVRRRSGLITRGIFHPHLNPTTRLVWSARQWARMRRLLVHRFGLGDHHAVQTYAIATGSRRHHRSNRSEGQSSATSTGVSVAARATSPLRPRAWEVAEPETAAPVALPPPGYQYHRDRATSNVAPVESAANVTPAPVAVAVGAASTAAGAPVRSRPAATDPVRQHGPRQERAVTTAAAAVAPKASPRFVEGENRQHRSRSRRRVITAASPELDSAGQFCMTENARHLVRQAIAVGLAVTCFTIEVEVEVPAGPQSRATTGSSSRVRRSTNALVNTGSTQGSRRLAVIRSQSERPRGTAVIENSTPISSRSAAAIVVASGLPTSPSDPATSASRHSFARPEAVPTDGATAMVHTGSTGPLGMLGAHVAMGSRRSVTHAQTIVEDDTAGTPPSPEEPSGAGEKSPARGAGRSDRLRVLVVDDARLNRMVLKRLVARVRVQAFGTRSPTVRAALQGELTDGSEVEPGMVAGCAAMGETVAQVVLMDLNMQHENGADTASRLRRSGCTACIVACTGDVATEEQLVDRPVPDGRARADAPSTGRADRRPVRAALFSEKPFDAVLTKPFDADGLGAAISRGLQHSEWAWGLR